MIRIRHALLCALVLLPVVADATFEEPVRHTFTYQGELEDGGSPANGDYNFEFTFFDCITGGTLIGLPVTVEDVTVIDGRFTALIQPYQIVNGTRTFLEIGVRPGASGGAYTTLAPRQELTATPFALTLAPNAVIADAGSFSSWLLRLESDPGSNTTGLEVVTAETGVRSTTTDGIAIDGRFTGTGLVPGVQGTSSSADPKATGVSGAVLGPGAQEESAGVRGINQGAGMGVYGEHEQSTGTAPGVMGRTASEAAEALGVLGEVESTTPGGFSAGVKGQNNGAGGSGIGVWGVHDGNGWGVYGEAAGGSGVYGFSNTGTGVLARSHSGDVFLGTNAFGNVFRVDTSGNVTADGTYTSPAADFAELLPSSGHVEPADVLIVNALGKLERSARAFDAAVAGVYSTRPAFLGGNTGHNAHDEIPLAVVGVVPVKVSGENGPITPGDLLVASGVPGHAMRAGDDPPNGTVIGKALQPMRDRTGVVRAILMLQ